MDIKEEGAQLPGRAPRGETYTIFDSVPYFNANSEARKQSAEPQPGNKFSQTREYLSAYLELGLEPLPLKGKIPLFPWKKWHPKSITDLEKYIKQGCDWGVRTGNGFVVLDFDTVSGYESFMAANVGKLPKNAPIVKTGRPGYHFWCKSNKPVRTQHYEGLDIKGENGYVCVPPSIHKSGAQYHFIRPLSQEIPTVDLDDLVLPRIKPDYETRPKGPYNPSEWTPVPFGHKAKIINEGADEGERHSGLVTYIGVMISGGRDKEWVVEAATLWNQMCRPPLPEEEVAATIESCWNAYAGRVPTKTHSNFSSVLVETRRAQEENAEARQKLLEELRAKEKAAELPHSTLCGKRHAISRQGKKYLSVAFFCGSWNCPRCADYFRRRRIKHLQEITGGITLYTTVIEPNDWDRVRKSLNRLGSEYMRIYTFEQTTLITNKPIPGSQPIPEGQLAERLETLIPHKFDFSPVSTSRGWQLERKEKKPETEKGTLVTRTFLPIDVQQAVAKHLGAKIVGECRWVSPENEDAQDWADKFSRELYLHEQHIWSETDKGRHIEKWVDDFNNVMEADDVFGGRKEWWEGRAG